MPIEIGKAAPLFTLAAQDGRKVSLKSLRGRAVALYFYPRDFTPGCTTESCDFRDWNREFEKAGVAVIGVSPDGADSHAKFAEKHKLKFTLLGDPDHKVMEKYGAWGKKMMYGKIVVGVIRSTVLIGPNGKVAQHWPKVRVKGHVEKVLEAARAL